MASFGRVPSEASLVEEIDGFSIALPGPPGGAPARRERAVSPYAVLPVVVGAAVAGLLAGPLGVAMVVALAAVSHALLRKRRPEGAQEPAVMLRLKGNRLAIHANGELVFETPMSDVALVEQRGWEVHLIGHEGTRLHNIRVSGKQVAEWLADVLRPLRIEGGEVPEPLKRLRGRAPEPRP